MKRAFILAFLTAACNPLEAGPRMELAPAIVVAGAVL
jgi:predicted small secreted protein